MRGRPSWQRRRTLWAALALGVGGVYAAWPALALPQVAAAPVPAPRAGLGQRFAGGVADGDAGRVAEAAAPLPAEARAESASSEPMVTRDYACKKGQCNRCHFRQSELRGSAKPLSDGSSEQARVNGTYVRRTELAAAGARILQVGGDWWNKCGDGWVNADAIFTRLPVGVLCEDWRTGRHIVRLDAGRPLPFEEGSFDVVYTEHMFEHMLPMAGATFLREAYRVLRPGGLIRLTTPDLAKYLEGYVHRDRDPFLADHARRWPPMGKLGDPPTAATVVNNIFRNYEHQWVYDFEEVVRTAQVAGIPAGAVRRSARLGADLPKDLIEAVERASQLTTAAHQAGRNENPTRCWLEQDIREPETLYVTITKPAAA